MLRPFVPGKKEADTGEKHSILYVEDEDANWEVTLLALRDKYTLRRAADARLAFEMLRAYAFDIILMDIQLSGSDLDGIEITQALRGTYTGRLPAYARGFTLPTIPIIFVTAYSARYVKDELLRAGGNDMISKPVSMVSLSLAITRLVARTIQDSE